MPRIRSIHPGLFTDPAYMALSAYAMAAWPGIWTEADDNGIFSWNHLKLKARLLPCALVEMTDILAEYEAQSLVRRFTAEDGRSFGIIRNFLKYQRPRRPVVVHPLPQEDVAAYLGGKPANAANKAASDLIISHRYENTSTALDGNDGERIPLNQMVATTTARTMSAQHPPQQPQSPTLSGFSSQREDVGGRRKEVEGRKNLPPSSSTELVAARSPATTGPSPPGSGDDEDDGDFEDFWEAYPRKVNRGRTRKAWITARNTQSAEQLLAAAQRYATENTGKTLSLVARPENWLHDQRWLDEPEHSTVNGASTNLAEPFAPGSPAHWRHRMRLWFDIEHGGPQRELWPRNWGPPPGDPDCQVPPDVLAEFT